MNHSLRFFSHFLPISNKYIVLVTPFIIHINFQLICHFNYRYAIDGIAILCVAIFGIIGTIMSIIVLLKPHICKRKERLQRSNSTYSSASHRREQYFSIFLTALCIFDCCFLMMSILYIALPSISGIDESTKENECSKTSLSCW